MNIYVIYDKKLCKFLPFMFLAENDDVCKRNMTQVLMDGSNSNLLKFPNDFNVHCVGSFGLELGDVSSCEHYLAFELISLFSKPEVKESEVKDDGVQNGV